MNKISDKEINNYLQEQWEYLKNNSGIEEQKIMGLFAIGKVCHGFANNLDDIVLVSCYVPTFEQLCLNIYPYEYEEHCGKIKMTDFRYIYNLLLEQNLHILECSFTDYKIINPLYQNSFEKYVFMNRETLFHYNNEKRIKNAISRGFDAIAEGDYYEACRIRIACELLLSGTSVENCINLKKDYHINYLQQVLDGKIIPSTQELENDYNDLFTRAEGYIVIEDTKKLMQDIIFNLYTIGLTKRKEFLNLLTDNELQAFKIIKSQLTKGEGYVSISQLTEGSIISRPVFKNVLQKMKESKVAEVTNKGVKGTFIQIKDFSIL